MTGFFRVRGGGMPNQDRDSARQMLLGTLLRRIEADPYPSSTMLDMTEALLTDDDVARYVDLLVGKIDGDLFPSIPLIRRVMAVT